MQIESIAHIQLVGSSRHLEDRIDDDPVWRCVQILAMYS